MTRPIQFITSASTASILACATLAQESPNLRETQPDQANDQKNNTRLPNQLNGAAKASDLIGMTVNNYQDAKLGKVDELAVDLESGRIVQVILSTGGGILGIGNTLTAVPPGTLHHDVVQKVLHLDADAEKLKKAPQFEMSKWAGSSDTDHLVAVYRYYGQERDLGFIQTGAASLDGPSSVVLAGKPTGHWELNSKSMQPMIPTARLAQLQRLSKLMGKSVHNLQDEKLGKVENVLVDLASGRLVAVIVSSGGFLGLGDELSAVPPTALRFTTDQEKLQLDTSKETLSNAPHFKANEWPDFGQPSYTDGIYRAYRVEPYFTTNVTAKPDNTSINVRDRNDDNLTPLDQGNGAVDVDITARIRRGIMDDKDFSVNAQNVKIITNKGHVTLRGPVNTAEEKRLIGVIAINIAMLENVNNQLDVK